MRISVPTIPPELLRVASLSHAVEDAATAIQRLAAFIAPGNLTVLTGAGVSVDSGIRAYRGKDGRYVNPNYKPILYHEIADESERGSAYRRRYWLRSFLGYPHVRDALPNPTHYALAALQYSGHIPRLVTQNVDGLHKRALGGLWTKSKTDESIVELHGTLHKVQCNRRHTVSRDGFQQRLGDANPRWAALMEEMERTGTQPRTNPDGDVVLEDGVSYDDFVIPECTSCLREGRYNIIHKPGLIFFGESISDTVKDDSYKAIDSCDRLLILGTTLATYSSFRLLKHAIVSSKPVLMVNTGPTRADVPGSVPRQHLVEKIELPVGDVVRSAVMEVLGARINSESALRRLLESGSITPLRD